ncbi:MAG: glycosyltransferase family 2 protein [Lachnospiraceae bacterium]
MHKATVIIPNYNGKKYLAPCLNSLKRQDISDFFVIVVDNGSTDGSVEFLKKEFEWVQVIALKQNKGFPAAVNIGIQAAVTHYVILLNNDTEAEPSFVRELIAGMERHPDAFSGSAKMLCYDDHQVLDDAGNLYSALGWAFAIGKGKSQEKYIEEKKVFSACAGAAIYRRKLFKKIGYFDETHFAYLEDIDVGYRAKINGYSNYFFPNARVYHVGSATTGSRYNVWKSTLSARNSVYVAYKNMPFFQLLLNMPFLLLGFGIKELFFIRKRLGSAYAKGLVQGVRLCKKDRKVPFRRRNLPQYIRIQLELWKNIFLRFREI